MTGTAVSRILLPTILLLMLSVMACFAAESTQKAAPSGGKKKLLLFAKNPATWAIVKGGANGKLIYQETSRVFDLNASGLNPRTLYVLVRYADVAPKIEILSKGTSDERGRLALNGTWHNWTKKFWLVPAEDVSGKVGETGSLVVWRPEKYLFEEKQLGITCLCPEPEEP
jgi:hypothetical protein